MAGRAATDGDADPTAGARSDGAPPDLGTTAAAATPHRGTTAHRAALLDIAATVLPDTDLSGATVSAGEFHDVVLLPGTAVVKVARGAAATHLRRRTDLLTRLDGLGLPFAVPRPLGAVVEGAGRAAVALSWVAGRSAADDGAALPPARLAQLLRGLADVPLHAVADVLDEPHAYAGRSRWPSLMAQAVELLPAAVRRTARRRLDAALALPPVAPGLVHGDLAGANLRLSDDGRVTGILDWDLAQPADPAVDAACLAWFGWDVVDAAVDAETARRARVWSGVFPIEQVAAALDNGESDAVVDRAVRRAADWIVRQDAGPDRPA